MPRMHRTVWMTCTCRFFEGVFCHPLQTPKLTGEATVPFFAGHLSLASSLNDHGGGAVFLRVMDARATVHLILAAAAMLVEIFIRIAQRPRRALIICFGRRIAWVLELRQAPRVPEPLGLPPFPPLPLLPLRRQLLAGCSQNLA